MMRAEVFLGRKVPEVLQSGNHQKIEEWRKNSSLKNTFAKRPDLLTKEEQEKAKNIDL